MSAQELVDFFYRGEEYHPSGQVHGCKQEKDIDMICDCDSDGECCGY